MNRIIVFSLTILFLQACEKPNPQLMSCNLYTRYEQDSRLIKAEATYYVEGNNGEKTQIALEGGVSFLSSNMPFSENLLRYQVDRKVDFPGVAVFAWNNSSGEKLIAEVKSSKIGDFNLKKANDLFILDIDASPLGKNEKLTLLINSEDDQKTNININGPSASNLIEISNEELTKLIDLPLSISIVRSKTYYEDLEHCSCSVTQSYYSKWKQIQI